ncbi:SNF2-related protein [Staphylococcus agnetis]|uniref:SNF2-related protein n=1 Tax=Staphylococcus agnetis TaxID=985762 RepID=UPI00208ED723|nr:SNF2-related protein [Staphylococcus agnetis]MCO4326170.1 SNF2-related protein [Staphylococcus agnetis]MCO4357004.1 SNF2-related protein [Staphylococcus agnetis]
MKQGTGKTRTALEIAKSTDSTLILFLVPHQLKHNIVEQINTWHFDLPYIIETYEGISMSDIRYLNLLDQLDNQKVMVIADESIFIKNGDAKRYKRILTIRDKSEYRLILNGTPITKNEWDIYYQMKFLSDKIIGMSESEFLQTFFKRIEYKKKYQQPKEFYQLSEVNIGYLKKLIEPYVFEVDLNLDIEEVTEYEVAYSSDEIYEDYQCLKEKFLNDIMNGDLLLNTLVQMQYLVFTDKQRCANIASTLKGQQIVYCSYLKEVEYISNNCDCYVITGETENREEILKQFKYNDKPLIITYGVGSFGHNLQFCNKITFASITFDYAKVEQAMYRIKRLGQERTIHYKYIKSDLGIYNLIFDNLTKKSNLHDLIIRDLEKIKEVI